MTREEKMKWLMRYRTLEKELQMKREDLIKWRSEAERITTTVSSLPKGKNSEIADRTAETVAKIVDLMNDMNEDIRMLLSIKTEVEEAIESVENGTYRILLKKRYIEGKKWENIAVEMNFCWQHLHKLHARALSKLNGD